MLRIIRFPILFVGPGNCTVSLTASRVTADSSVVRWGIHNCVGSVPTSCALYWYPVGEIIRTYNYKSFNFSSTNQYRITGLSPSTKYVIYLSLTSYRCGHSGYFAIADILLSGEFHPCMDNTQVFFYQL